MEPLQELGKYQARRRAALALLVPAMFATLLFVRSVWWDRFYILHDWIVAFGVCLIGFAIAGRVWCTLYVGGRKATEIVRSGPYSVSRNPLYVFSTLGAVGIGALSGSLVVAFVLGLLCYVFFSVVIRREEHYLQATFAEIHSSYCQKVPRFFPRFSLFHDDDLLTVKPDRVYRTFLDGMVFFAAYPAFAIIGLCQERGIVPVLLQLY